MESALAECSRLRGENARLRELLASHGIQPEPQPERRSTGDGNAAGASLVTSQSSPEAKLALFRSLFRGREDAYAVRWEAKDGRCGYSPASIRDWNTVLASRPQERKKVDRETRQLLPLTDEVVRGHLTGKHTIGVYPLLLDETCWLLAVDFDKKTWQTDAGIFLGSCRELGVQASLERSRSGNGGHVWIFFDRPVPAVTARNLGCALLTRSMEQRHQMGLDSYDRFFPNQDTLPKGGFGNLIALPLQKGPRERGNSVFVDSEFKPYADQWQYLSTVRRVPAELVEALVQEATRQGEIVGVRRSLADNESDEDPWMLPPSKKRREKPITAPLPKCVRITHGNLVYVEKKDLPSSMLDRLIRLAAFQNPEFYKAQAMRLSTFGKPRVIGCAEDFPQHIGLPRGCLDEAVQLFQAHGVEPDIRDERFAGNPIDATFHGQLRAAQQAAVAQIMSHDNGIVCAPTAFGKTTLAAWLVAKRKVNTLVLVHRRQLLDQWRERLAMFLNLPAGSIGQIGGGKATRTGSVDVGVIQSLQRKGEVKDFVAEYGQVIVDECHHLPAFTFERVLKQVKARYVLGLTATPIRKDGHHPILYMQCGPVRFNLSARKMAQTTPFEHRVIPRCTEFRMPAEPTEVTIHDVYAAMVNDIARNQLIVQDLVEASQAGRSPLLLTGRTEHLSRFASLLEGRIQNVFVLKGGMGRKQREAITEALAAVPEREQRAILATGSYIGEGFDDARLDTLFLAMPISWRGTLQQYVGRLHRLHDNKKVVQVYDYVDTLVPMLARMYGKRLRGYQAIGYKVEDDARGKGRTSWRREQKILLRVKVDWGDIAGS
ncbi:MAG: DEAD/DEAH box helicase family protein [Acidobacteria bacterium]|nr:DEAD/DEAH box helicase family protein [Acidobacteriota bacterium]